MYIRHTADNKLFVASVVFRALYLAWTTQTFPRDASTISSRARAAAGEGKEEKKNWQHTHTHTHRAVGGGRKKWGAHAFPSQCTFTCWYVSVSSLHCGNVFMRIYTRLVRARAWCVWFDCLKKTNKKKTSSLKKVWIRGHRGSHAGESEHLRLRLVGEWGHHVAIHVVFSG